MAWQVCVSERTPRQQEGLGREKLRQCVHVHGPAFIRVREGHCIQAAAGTWTRECVRFCSAEGWDSLKELENVRVLGRWQDGHVRKWRHAQVVKARTRPFPGEAPEL